MDTTKSIAIFGKGGHGKVIADIAYANGYTTIIWVDDFNNEAISEEEFYAKYKDMAAIVAIGDNRIRERVQKRLMQNGVEVTSLIHPTATISKSVTIAKGVAVMPKVVINADTTIGQGAIINSGAIIEHDNIIEPFVHISPNAALAGNVHVKHLSHVGIGAAVIQGVTIGEESVIGAGSVVISDIEDNTIAVGVPAHYKKVNNER